MHICFFFQVQYCFHSSWSSLNLGSICLAWICFVLRLSPSFGFVTVWWCGDSLVTDGCSGTNNVGCSLVGDGSCCSRCIGWGGSGGSTAGVRGSLISLALFRSGRLLLRFMYRVSSPILWRNQWFRSVIHWLLSIKTWHFLYGRAFTIMPMGFQCWGCCPSWVWITIGFLTLSGLKYLSWMCLVVFMKCWLTAFSCRSVFVMHCPNIIVVKDHDPLKGLFGDQDLSRIQNPQLFWLKEKTLRYQFNI